MLDYETWEKKEEEHPSAVSPFFFKQRASLVYTHTLAITDLFLCYSFKSSL